MPEKNPVMEQAKLRPISPYGSSKLMTEMMLGDTAAASDLRYVALRYFNVAVLILPEGAASRPRMHTHLIKVAVQTALGQRPHLEVFGADYPTPDGSCIRDYIHVHDLARAHLTALTYLRRGGASQVLNCGYGRGYSVFDVISSVRRVARVDFPVRIGQRRSGDPAALVADATRIREVLDWRPEFDDLDAIVEHALRWEPNSYNIARHFNCKQLVIMDYSRCGIACRYGIGECSHERESCRSPVRPAPTRQFGCRSAPANSRRGPRSGSWVRMGRR